MAGTSRHRHAATAFAPSTVGLVTAVLLLTVHAWAAGRPTQVRGRRLLFAGLTAAGLGLAVIVLDSVVLTRLH